MRQDPSALLNLRGIRFTPGSSPLVPLSEGPGEQDRRQLRAAVHTRALMRLPDRMAFVRRLSAVVLLMTDHATCVGFIDAVNVIHGVIRLGGERVTRATLLQPLQTSIVIVHDGAHPFRLD